MRRDEDGKREKQRAKAEQQLNVFQQQMASGLTVDKAEYIKVAKQCVRRSAAFDAQLQSALDQFGFGYETAPFEADSQLTYLARTGRIEYTITEDSDFVTLRIPG